MANSPKENLIMALRHQTPEYIPNFRLEAMSYIPSCIHERAPGDGSPQQRQGGTGKDWFGVEWLFEPTVGGSMVNPRIPPMLYDVNEWKEVVKFPNLDAIDWQAARERDEELIDRDKLLVITILNGPFERMHSLMGMIDANCALVTDPEVSAELLMAIAEYKMKLIDKIVEYYPVDMIEVHDDWGHQKSTFMSPDTWDALIAPAMKKIVAHVKSKGKLFMLHSCGKIESLIPRIIEIGIDHWSSCQTCNDIDGIIARYGDKITLLGGMDTPELSNSSKSRSELKELAAKRIDKICRGCGLLVYGSMNNPTLIDVITEVIEERKHFFSKPENRELPRL